MKDIPDGSVDMVLCDLPYGVTRNKWDSVIPLEPLWEQYLRVCKENAAICLFSQMPFTVTLVSSNPKLFKYEWIYEKLNPTGFLNSHRMPLKAHENICVYYKNLPTYHPQFIPGEPYTRKRERPKRGNYVEFDQCETRCDKGDRFPRDVIKFSRGGYDRGLHPTQKPVALLEYLIRTYTDEGETVLDNCMGSGSTGIACINTGRNFIGMELDKGYFEIAKERISNHERSGADSTESAELHSGAPI